MEEKNEILKFISEIHRKEIHDRRQYEWKAFMGSLTFFVLATAARLSGQVQLPEGCTFRTVVWVVFPGLAMIFSCFLKRLQGRSAINRRFAEEAENALITASSNTELNKVLQLAQKDNQYHRPAG